MLHFSHSECLEEELACWEDPIIPDCSERIHMFEAKAGEKLGLFALLNEEVFLSRHIDTINNN